MKESASMTPTREESGTQDSVAKKTILSPQRKIELICRYGGGARLKALAVEYGIAYSTAHKICTDKKLKASLFDCKDNFALVKNLRVHLSPLNFSNKAEHYSGAVRLCSDDAVSSGKTSAKELVHEESPVGSDLNTSVIQCKKQQGSPIESPKPLGLDRSLDIWVKSMKENSCPITDCLLVEKARQFFVEVTGSEEGFSDSCEWLLELKRKYGLINGRQIGKGLSHQERNDPLKKKLNFEDKKLSKRKNVSPSKCNESSDVVENPVREEDSRDIPPKQATFLEKKKSSPSKEASEDVNTDVSLSALKIVPKGQFKVKFNFHRKNVTFSPEVKKNDGKGKKGPQRIRTPGAKKNIQSKFDRIKYDFVKKLASKQNLGLPTAKDIHSDKKKLEAFMSKCIVKVKRESLQSVRFSSKNVEAAGLPLNEIKGFENSEKLETGGDNSLTLKASCIMSQSKSKSSVPKIVVEEFSGKKFCTSVDSAGSMNTDVKEHQETYIEKQQDTHMNYLEKFSETDQPPESAEMVKHSSLVTEMPKVTDKGRPFEIVQAVEDCKKNRVTDEKISLKLKLKPGGKQKTFKSKETGFNQEIIKKLASKYDIGASAISEISKDKKKLKAFLTTCEVSVKCVEMKQSLSSTSEVTTVSEQKYHSVEVQDLERNPANVELSCKDVKETSSKRSRKRKRSVSGEEVLVKKRCVKNSVGFKTVDSVSEDKNELVSFLSPCVVHVEQDLDAYTSIDGGVESPNKSPLEVVEEPLRQTPVKGSCVKSPKQRPVKASSKKSTEQSPVQASSAASLRQGSVSVSSTESIEPSTVTARSAKSPKQSPVAAESAKSPKQSPFKASSVKSLEQSPCRASCTESHQQIPVTANSEKSAKQSPAITSIAQSPKQSPVQAKGVKLSVRTPVKTSSAKSPKQSPFKANSAESHKQNLVKDSCVKSPGQSPVNAKTTKYCRQNQTKATSARSSKQSPVKASSSNLPEQSLVKISTCNTKSPKHSPVKVRGVISPKHSSGDAKEELKEIVDQGEMVTSKDMIKQPETSSRATGQNGNGTAELVGISTNMTEKEDIPNKLERKGVDTAGVGLTEIDAAVAEQTEIDALGIQKAELDTSVTQLEESIVEEVQQSKTGATMVQHKNVAKVVEKNSQTSTSQTEYCFDAVKQVKGTHTHVKKLLVETPKGKNLGKSEVTVDKLAEDYDINDATVQDIRGDSEKLKAFLSPCFVNVKREPMRHSQTVTESPSSVTTVGTPEPVSPEPTFRSPTGIIRVSLGSAKKGKGKGGVKIKFKFF